MTFKTRMSVLVLSTPVLAFVLVGGLMGAGNNAQSSGQQTYRHLRMFDDVVDLVMNDYVGDVPVGDKASMARCGASPMGSTLTARFERRPGEGGQMGEAARRRRRDRADAPLLPLHHCRPRWLGGPEGGAAHRRRDQAINGKPTRDMSVFEGARVFGKAGTKVTLTIIRGNAANPHEVVLVREKVAGPIVTSRLIVRGYLRIVSFRNGVVEELRKHAADSTKGGAKNLIVDVRRTAEGPLDNGIAAARVFIKSGTPRDQGGAWQARAA